MTVRIRVAVTDSSWFALLKAQPEGGEANFWQPSNRTFKALSPGELLLFKLRGPEDSIVGGGFFLHFAPLPYPIAWETFGQRNGVVTLAEMKSRIERYRREQVSPEEQIGCTVLKDPFFWAESQWFSAPVDFTRNVVSGKNYDTSTEVGQRLWEDVAARLRSAGVELAPTDAHITGPVGMDGLPLKEGTAEHYSLLVDLSVVNDQLLNILAREPELLRRIEPRKFEEVVAEVLSRQGYEVQLTPSSRDGGFDIYAARKEGLGQFLYLVECKRFVPPHKVGVGVIRSLYGVVQSQRATAGVIVTTSHFTADAEDYGKSIRYQMQLHDFVALKGWLAALGFRSR